MSSVALNHCQNVVLLSAGCGSRMGALTYHRPKSLLEVGDKTVLDYLLEAIIERTSGEIVVVTGFQAALVEQHLAKRYGDRVKTAHNPRYSEDVNILSVETGVAALARPELGYLIVETDLLLDETAWDKVFHTVKNQYSFWVCKDQYRADLTGGIVKVDISGRIQAVEYQPKYDESYDGWPKMVGLLWVGPSEVSADRRLRQDAILHSIKQYYLITWCQHLSQLPCRVLDLADSFAASFNNEIDYFAAVEHFLKLKLPDRRIAIQSTPHGVTNI